MSDSHPTADQQDTGSRGSRGLSVVAAADRLGLTPDAVRGRLHRGTLEGEKVGTEWRVFLPDDKPTADRQAAHQPATATRQSPAADHQDATADRQDTAVERQGPDRTDEGPLVALVADLARRNEELAAAAAMWQARAAHLEDRLLALATGDTTPADAPQAAQEPRHAAHPAETAPDASQSWWASWWRRLTGGAG